MLAASAPACDLPDVNVWLALINTEHAYHLAAKAYWDQAGGQRIAFCRITMLGLLRLSTNKIVMGGAPYTTEEAWHAYQAFVALPEVGFVAEPMGIEANMQALTLKSKAGTPDWTDTYLAVFANLASLRIVSFDKGFKQYSELTLLSLQT